MVWALANAAEALEISLDVQAVALGLSGLVLVAGSLAIARLSWVHVAAVGHAAGLLALAIPEWPGWAPTTVLALGAFGWWFTTLLDNHGEAIHLHAVRSALNTSDSIHAPTFDITAEAAGLVALGLTVGAAASAILAADANIEPSWVALACAAAVLFDAGAVRAIRWTRARRRVFEWATFVGAVVAVVVAISETAHLEDDWSAIVTTAIGLAVLAIATPPRALAFVWTAWVGGAAITVLLGNRLGLAQDVLDTLLAAWGAVVLVGGVGVQRRLRGPVPRFRMGSDQRFLPPIMLGAAAFAAGGEHPRTDTRQVLRSRGHDHNVPRCRNPRLCARDAHDHRPGLCVRELRSSASSVSGHGVRMGVRTWTTRRGNGTALWEASGSWCSR